MRFFTFLSCIFSYITFFLFGDLNTPLYALISFVLIDYITGVIKAIIQHNLSSKIGRKGILHKVMIFIIIAISNIIDNTLLFNHSNLRDLTILFYITNEFISIIENAIEMNIPFPDKIKELFEFYKKK